MDLLTQHFGVLSLRGATAKSAKRIKPGDEAIYWDEYRRFGIASFAGSLKLVLSARIAARLPRQPFGVPRNDVLITVSHD